MDKKNGVMNSVIGSAKEHIVNELNTLTNQELQWFVADWEVNSKIKPLNYLEEMTLDLAKLTIQVRKSNSMYTPAGA